MKFSELHQDIQQDLRNQQSTLYKDWYCNDAYHILFTNKEGTRYFSAYRKSLAGQYGIFGGGSQWIIKYGQISWKIDKDPMGGKEYSWCKSSKTFGKSLNGTEIPKTVNTKKEVMSIVESIGTLITEI